NDFETFDFAAGGSPGPGRRPILQFDDKNRITSLFDFIKKNYSEKAPQKEPANTENEGTMRSTFFPCILADIYEKKKTGILSIKSNSNLDVYFSGGVPTFAEGGDVETAIGRILLDRGKIDRESYEKAIDISASTEQKFGEVLFGMGMTSPHELNVYLELQIEEKILRGFYYLQGRYEFRDGPNSPNGAVSYHLNLPRLVYEGIKRYVDVEDLEDRNPVVEVKPRLKTEVNSLGLKPKELRFVQLLKPRAHLREVLESSRLEKDETLKLLYFLSLFRLISIPGLAVDRVGRASIEKRLGEMEPETAAADIAPEETEETFEETSKAVSVTEETPGLTPETGFEIEEGETEEKVWEIGMDDSLEDAGEEDGFSLTLEESAPDSGESGFTAEEDEKEPEGLSLDEDTETGEEDPLSGIEDLLLDRSDAPGEVPKEEAPGGWRPFRNDESPMPWEGEGEGISIEPASMESEETSEIETEASDNEPGIDLSSPSESPGTEPRAYETKTEPETSLGDGPNLEEEKIDEQVWEIDVGSFDEPEESAGEELEV
ncbi:MAG: hypothetical protein KJ002_13450, partial [Candidatus Dadabacteria bacterium]|nr:hypothetical protein [Candidatus Dadabacteria bacterium]